ncbi:MAG TPA: anti-sigma factor [Gemmatimonadales bacterium]|nr:anti-sigma factor [Gemmatimonadales bacterium]
MTGHEWLGQAAAYALDALDSNERVAFESHLATCVECRAEVDSFRETAGRLAVAAPATLPSPAVRDRVLAEARRVRPIRSARSSWAPWLAAAAGFLLAILLGGAWWRERGERNELATRVAQQDDLLTSLLAPDIGVANLSATGKPPSARLFWDSKRQRVVVAVFDLPPAPAGRTYQLWAIAKGQAPVSVGTFNTPSSGRLTTVLAAPPGLAFDLTAVTEEPAGGSPQPTQTPFLVGPLQRSE